MFKDATNKTTLFILILCLMVSLSLLAQEKRDIDGVITFNSNPVQDVNIKIEGTSIGTKTDAFGHYVISVKTGDVLVYSHIGFQKTTIVIEDVTSELNLELKGKENQLKETVVIAKTTKIKSSKGIEYNTNTRIKTAAGYINPFLFPSAVYYFPAKELNLKYYASIEEALKWKMPENKIPVIYDVDGLIFRKRPSVDFNRIKDVYVITGGAGTMRWGGPVILIHTLDHPDEIKKRKEEKAEKYRNQKYYANDAQTVDSKTVFNSSNSLGLSSSTTLKKSIFGIITHLDKPLSDVNIKIKNKPFGTKSDNSGNYKITAEIGDEIEYRYTGLQSISLIIEDITEEVNIDMLSFTNPLDEVIVTAKTTEGNVLKRAKKADEAFDTSRGKFNPKKAGYSIAYINGDEVLPIHKTLSDALKGKFAGFNRGNASITNPASMIWDVDGAIYNVEPPLDLTNIKDVHILKSLAATNKYGTIGRGGVIVVRTKYGTFDSNTEKKRIAEQYTNKTFYNDDAIVFNVDELSSNSYTKTLEAFKNKGKAYKFYNENLKKTIKDFDVHIDIAQKFFTHYKDPYKAVEILNGLAIVHQRNPEILKAIAFNLQVLNATKEAVSMFKHIAKMRPNYAQSYRDLANAYKENNEFKMAWRIYMNYLINRNTNKASSIDQIVYNEMEYLYFNRQHQTGIKEQFIPNNESKLKFRNDVRFVIEWNTSEAEFNLEFVGPDKRAYEFKHTLSDNQDLITNEKLKGYSSDEYFVDDIGTGEWLVNLTYYGNKKSTPSYLKITSYYHWGKPKQHQKISVYKLKKENQKIQLRKINSQTLLTYN